VAIPSRAEGLFASTDVVVAAIADVTIPMPQARVLADEWPGPEIARAIERPGCDPREREGHFGGHPCGQQGAPQVIHAADADEAPQALDEIRGTRARGGRRPVAPTRWVRGSPIAG
jgi:hypothetical protein